MPLFSYVANDVKGRIIRGKKNAGSKEHMAYILQRSGLIPVEVYEMSTSLIKENKSSFGNPKLKAKDVAVFCRQFSSVMKAGVTVLRCVDLLRKQTESRLLKGALNNIYEDLQKGSALSEAMKKQRIFPSMLINMIEAGEISGTLDESLEKMAVHYEKDYKLVQKVKGALTYPAIVGVICIIACFILLTFVVPQFAAMFETFDAKLPATTQLLLDSGSFAKSYWYIILALIVGLIVGFIYFKNTGYGKRFIDDTLLKMPIFSVVIKKMISARFSRTMSTMISTGIPMLKSLEVTEKVIDNVIAEEKIKMVRGQVVKGGVLSEHLSQVDIFPVMVPHMVSIGEESGAIDKMLEKTADYYDQEVDAAITQLTTFIEPAIILVMGGIVGFIVISIIQPMFQMYQNIQ